MLIDKGYVDKNVEEKLYKNTLKKDGESYYIMFLANGSDYCDKSEITALASWMEEGKTVYLCNNYENNFNELDYIRNNLKIKYSNKYAVSKEYIENNNLSTSKFTSDENGIFIFNHNTKAGNFLYTYYRGVVENNYLKLGKDANGNDLFWRIVWIRDDNKMKIVLDKTVPVNINNKSDNALDIKGQKLYKFINETSINNGEDYVFLAPRLDTFETYYNENRLGNVTVKYDLYLPDESKWVSDFDFNKNEGEIHQTNSFFMKKTLDWYNTTNLNEYSFITKENNFCINESIYEDDEWDWYYPSENFDCAKGDLSDKDSPKDYSKLPNFYSSPVGFLTYGDALMAGLSSLSSGVNNLYDSKNYLISDNNIYPLQDLASLVFYRNNSSKRLPYKVYENYAVGVSGILKDDSYSQQVEQKDYKVTYKIYDHTKSNVLISSYNNHSSYIYYYYKFFANSIKPTMILDLTNYDLSNNSGTINDYYTIVAK